MEKVTMSTRLAVAAVALLFGLLLAGGQKAAAAGYDDTEAATPATEAAPAAKAAAAGYDNTEAATPATKAAPAGKAADGGGYTPATDAAEATPSEGKASYGKASKAECEIPGTCDTKVAAVEQANSYTRGCNKLLGCRG